MSRQAFPEIRHYLRLRELKRKAGFSQGQYTADVGYREWKRKIVSFPGEDKSQYAGHRELKGKSGHFSGFPPQEMVKKAVIIRAIPG